MGATALRRDAVLTNSDGHKKSVGNSGHGIEPIAWPVGPRGSPTRTTCLTPGPVWSLIPRPLANVPPRRSPTILRSTLDTHAAPQRTRLPAHGPSCLPVYDPLRPERSPAQGTSTHGDSAEARLGRPRIHRRGLLQPYHVALTAAPTERPCRTVPCGQPSRRPGPIPLQVPAPFYCIRSTH